MSFENELERLDKLIESFSCVVEKYPIAESYKEILANLRDQRVRLIEKLEEKNGR